MSIEIMNQVIDDILLNKIHSRDKECISTKLKNLETLAVELKYLCIKEMRSEMSKYGRNNAR